MSAITVLLTSAPRDIDRNLSIDPSTTLFDRPLRLWNGHTTGPHEADRIPLDTTSNREVPDREEGGDARFCVFFNYEMHYRGRVLFWTDLFEDYYCVEGFTFSFICSQFTL
jgi:hypothetical protein